MSTESSATKPLWPLEGHSAPLKLPAAATGDTGVNLSLPFSLFFFSFFVLLDSRVVGTEEVQVAVGCVSQDFSIQNWETGCFHPPASVRLCEKQTVFWLFWQTSEDERDVGYFSFICCSLYANFALVYYFCLLTKCKVQWVSIYLYIWTHTFTLYYLYL